VALVPATELDGQAGATSGQSEPAPTLVMFRQTASSLGGPAPQALAFAFEPFFETGAPAQEEGRKKLASVQLECVAWAVVGEGSVEGPHVYPHPCAVQRQLVPASRD
jgi:hypothetical protein